MMMAVIKRRELAQHRQADQIGDEDVGAVLPQLVGALIGDHDAEQERQQPDDRQRVEAGAGCCTGSGASGCAPGAPAGASARTALSPMKPSRASACSQAVYAAVIAGSGQSATPRAAARSGPSGCAATSAISFSSRGGQLRKLGALRHAGAASAATSSAPARVDRFERRTIEHDLAQPRTACAGERFGHLVEPAHGPASGELPLSLRRSG